MSVAIVLMKFKMKRWFGNVVRALGDKKYILNFDWEIWKRAVTKTEKKVEADHYRTDTSSLYVGFILFI